MAASSLHGGPLRALASAAIAVAAVVGGAPSGGVERALAANAATWVDPSGDAVGLGGDVTTVRVSNDDAGAVTFRVDTPNRPTLTTTENLQLYLDTDRNRATGTNGYEYRLRVFGGSSPPIRLERWDGSTWDPSTPQSTLSATWSGGLAATLSRSELSGTSAFELAIVTVDGTTGTLSDRAPDGALTERWAYQVVMEGAPPVDPQPPPADPPSPGPPPDVTPPTPPVLTRLEPVRQATAYRIVLRWEPATDTVGVTDYVVYRNGTLLWVGPPATACAGTPCTLVDTQVSKGSKYSYYVVARDRVGNVSAPSQSLVACADVLPRALDANGNGCAGPFARIRARVAVRYQVLDRSIRVLSLRVRGVPSGGVVSLRGAGVREVLRVRGTSVSSRAFAGHVLTSGATVSLAVSRVGSIGQFERWRVRGGRLVRVARACLAPTGSRTPVACRKIRRGS